MNDGTTTGCPRIEDVSALLDGALAAVERQEMTRHVAGCPLCAATLRDFEAMRVRMHALREARCDADLASLIAPRLPAGHPGPGHARPRRWPSVWQLAPRGLAAAGTLAAGVYLGLAFGGGAALAPRSAAMAVFDAAPPGSLCAGLPLCSPRGR